MQELTKSQQDVSHNTKAPIPTHPQGWEPGVSFTHGNKKGTITSRPTTNASPKFEDLLRDWGFDPKHYTILQKSGPGI